MEAFAYHLNVMTLRIYIHHLVPTLVRVAVEFSLQGMVADIITGNSYGCLYRERRRKVASSSNTAEDREM